MDKLISVKLIFGNEMNIWNLIFNGMVFGKIYFYFVDFFWMDLRLWRIVENLRMLVNNEVILNYWIGSWINIDV